MAIKPLYLLVSRTGEIVLLHVQVRPAGAILVWVRIAEISLPQAREKAHELHNVAKRGRNPGASWSRNKLQ